MESSLLEIKILGSSCEISNQYLEYVQEIVLDMGVPHSIEKIDDELLINEFGVNINCLYGYCPGCAMVAKENPHEKSTPALLINGKLIFHSGYPGDDAVRHALKENYPVDI